MIIEANRSHQSMIQTLWNSQDWIYSDITMEDITKWIEQEGNLFLVQMNEEKLEGLIFGYVNRISHKAYLSMIIVKREKRNQRIGTTLFNKWVDLLIMKDPMIESIDIVFFDPNSFEWKVSKSQDVFHPNSPGVHLERGLISFFEKANFFQYARQEVFYRTITDFEFNQNISTKIESLKQEDIAIEIYDPKIHQGFDDFFRRNNMMHWFKDASEGMAIGQKVLVATKNNFVIGFAGPLAVENTKRGYFSGIGIDRDYRGKGLGTVLFHRLCLHLSRLGAAYMTLFTGTSNPARKIYLETGFTVTDTFVNLRKMIR